MCTVVLLRRPGHAWPAIIAANRDEAVNRPWRPPARHWPDRPGVLAGLDEEAGGSWMGLNEAGVMAAILNRRGSLGPATGKRTRGALVLEALDHDTAGAAAAAMAQVDGSAYRSFNMLIADREDAFWVRHAGGRGVSAQPVGAGLSMLTAWDLNDRINSDRTDCYLPRFEAARPPDPHAPDGWADWETLLASEETAPGVLDPNGAMHVRTDWGFGTVSRALLALPADGNSAPVWRFASTWPETGGYVELH